MTSPDDPTRPGEGTRDAQPSAPPAGDAPTGRRTTPPADAPRPGAEHHPGTERRPAAETPEPGGRKTAGLWLSLILGAIVLVLLLIFVLQNTATAHFAYFAAEFDMQLGVAMLLAAIAGALVMALVGSVRMVQMSWTIRKLRKQQEKIHRTTR